MTAATGENYSPEARAAQEWRRIARMRDEDVSLAEGALWIAASEYPGLAIDDYLARLHEMAAKLRGRLRADVATAEKLLALNHYLFDELGFSGNGDDFYDPRNSFLNEVIERRVGIPITLGVVYIEIGRRIGLGLHGVSFPGHFLVKCALRDGIVVLDPYSGGVSLGADELQQRLRAAGSPGDVDDAILSHLLSAARTRSLLSRTAVSGRPTSVTFSSPLAMSTSTCTGSFKSNATSQPATANRGASSLSTRCGRRACAAQKRLPTSASHR
jgi:regulator of sirC expression with transglutaminase-like and TPR domain